MYVFHTLAFTSIPDKTTSASLWILNTDMLRMPSRTKTSSPVTDTHRHTKMCSVRGGGSRGRTGVDRGGRGQGGERGEHQRPMDEGVSVEQAGFAELDL